jgi:ribosomal protein S3AE
MGPLFLTKDYFRKYFPVRKESTRIDTTTQVATRRISKDFVAPEALCFKSVPTGPSEEQASIWSAVARFFG